MWVNQILNNNHQRREELIRNTFRLDIATTILKTAIHENEEDQTEERNGLYSVASRYRIAFKMIHPPVEQLSEQCREKKLWDFGVRTPMPTQNEGFSLEGLS
ncbi:hypothetical protein AAHE18_10G189900 [Arachis hypogaea]